MLLNVFNIISLSSTAIQLFSYSAIQLFSYSAIQQNKNNKSVLYNRLYKTAAKCLFYFSSISQKNKFKNIFNKQYSVYNYLQLKNVALYNVCTAKYGAANKKPYRFSR